MNRVNKKVSNNRYLNCPARMDDGRHFTNYEQNMKTNKTIENKNNIKQDSNAYREFLIKNAKTLMQQNKDEMNRLNSCLCNL